MKRTQELFEKIERYLAKELSNDEILAFEKEMAMDQELKEEVDKHRDLHQVFQDTDTLKFREKLQKISAELKEEELAKKNSTSYFSYLKIAASVIVILGVGTLLWNNFNKKDKFSDVYLSYYEPYPVEDVTRGEAISNLSMVMNNYTKRDYDKVILELLEIPPSAISEQLRLYLGNSYLNINNEKEALKQFEIISDTSKYYEDATWYRALTYLKLGENQESTVILEEIIEYNGIYKESAEKLINELKE